MFTFVLLMVTLCQLRHVIVILLGVFWLSLATISPIMSIFWVSSSLPPPRFTIVIFFVFFMSSWFLIASWHDPCCIFFPRSRSLQLPGILRCYVGYWSLELSFTFCLLCISNGSLIAWKKKHIAVLVQVHLLLQLQHATIQLYPPVYALRHCCHGSDGGKLASANASRTMSQEPSFSQVAWMAGRTMVPWALAFPLSNHEVNKRNSLAY